MQQPNQILRAQSEWQEKNQSVSSQAEVLTFIQISVGDSEFLLPILDIKEVAELPALRPYPIRNDGHIAVANIRGNVIPIVSMSCFFDCRRDLADEATAAKRLIVLSSEDGELFGILGRSVKKVTTVLPENQGDKTIRINDRPVRLISRSDILQGWGVKAC